MPKKINIMGKTYYLKFARIHGPTFEPDYGICVLACDENEEHCIELLRIYHGGHMEWLPNLKPFEFITNSPAG